MQSQGTPRCLGLKVRAGLGIRDLFKGFSCLDDRVLEGSGFKALFEPEGACSVQGLGCRMF